MLNSTRYTNSSRSYGGTPSVVALHVIITPSPGFLPKIHSSPVFLDVIFTRSKPPSLPDLLIGTKFYYDHKTIAGLLKILLCLIIPCLRLFIASCILISQIQQAHPIHIRQ